MRYFVYLLPIRNLNTTNMPMFVETAAAIVKTMNSTLQLWYKGRRPYISDRGAMTVELALVRFAFLMSTYTKVRN